MSTRAYIGKWIDKEAGKLLAVYHHFDGYPSVLGRTLFNMAQEMGSFDAVLEYVMMERVGWSSLNQGFFHLPPVFQEVSRTFGLEMSTHQKYLDHFRRLLQQADDDIQPLKIDINQLDEYFRKECVLDLKKHSRLQINIFNDNEDAPKIEIIEKDDPHFKDYVMWMYCASRSYTARGEKASHEIEINGKTIKANWLTNIEEMLNSWGEYFYAIDVESQTMACYDIYKMGNASADSALIKTVSIDNDWDIVWGGYGEDDESSENDIVVSSSPSTSNSNLSTNNVTLGLNWDDLKLLLSNANDPEVTKSLQEIQKKLQDAIILMKKKDKGYNPDPSE